MVPLKVQDLRKPAPKDTLGIVGVHVPHDGVTAGYVTSTMLGNLGKGMRLRSQAGADRVLSVVAAVLTTGVTWARPVYDSHRGRRSGGQWARTSPRPCSSSRRAVGWARPPRSAGTTASRSWGIRPRDRHQPGPDAGFFQVIPPDHAHRRHRRAAAANRSLRRPRCGPLDPAAGHLAAAGRGLPRLGPPLPAPGREDRGVIADQAGPRPQAPDEPLDGLRLRRLRRRRRRRAPRARTAPAPRK
ncbi:hypothetical protein QJS66_15510 [Kocuria rhizophila]|nr:hypothetical protein QJS66_15510 [Kocuria rhizophila]